KPLVNASAALDAFNRLSGHGLSGSTSINWTELIEFKNSFTNGIPDKERKDLAERGIDFIQGQAHFVDRQVIEIDGTRHSAGKILIATGMVPRPLGFDGADLTTTSDEFLELTDLPERIVFVGAGYVTMELAQVAARAGATVDIVEMTDRPLQPFDSDLVELLVEDCRELGIRFHFGSCVDQIERTDEGLVACCSENGQTYAADLVVHGAGRVPSLHGMDLEAADIAVEDGAVAVNKYLQSTTNPAVYAAGDCSATAGKPLTPVANLEADVVAHNLVEGNSTTPDYTGVPSAVFTTPSLAAVGMLEDQAREHPEVDLDIRFQRVDDQKEMQQLGIRRAAYKLLVDKATDRLLGAHLYGPAAHDTVNLAATAIRLDISTERLGRVIFTYPTLTGSLGWML
ncbi:MAG: dihydrolipoyl dehydrogenase family protein, partial [Planctomycetota bacterium]